MTITVKVHVNGNYRATVKHDGDEPVIVNGGEEKNINFQHGKENSYTITEEYMGDKK